MGNCFSSCFGTSCAQQNGRQTTVSKGAASKPVTSFTPIHTIATANVDRPSTVTTQVARLSPTVDDSLYRTAPQTNLDKMFGGRLPVKRNSSESKRISFSSKEPSESKIVIMFEQYKNPEEDAILAEGVEQFCKDLNVRPEEFRVLVLAWKFNAETMCRFTRTEFIAGCKSLKADSIKGIQSKFNDMLKEVRAPDTFKEFYRWTYKFGLDYDQGQRTLPTDIAIGLWQLVFTQQPPAILGRWLAFLDSHPEIKGIPRDTWDMFLHFVEQVGSDLSNYDDTEAWPSLLDDFVEHENDRQNQNVEKPRDEMW